MGHTAGYQEVPRRPAISPGARQGRVVGAGVDMTDLLGYDVEAGLVDPK